MKMKVTGKVKISGLMLIAIVFLCGIAYVFTPQPHVYASTTIFEDQDFYAEFDTPLKKASITNGSIYVVNEKGEKVSAAFSLKEKNKVLVIQDLSEGIYTLHVEKTAFKKKPQSDMKLQFSVVKELQAIQSQQDLRDYFNILLNEQRNLPGEMEAEKTESFTSEDTAGSHSGTNNQVDGIEEGDIAVTDGKHIYSIHEQSIFITDAKKMEVISKINIPETYPSKLLLHEGKLLVFYDKYVEEKARRGYYGGTSMTQVAIYDMSNASKPQLIREVGQEGHAVGIREYKDVLYIVTNNSPNYWLLREEKNLDLRPRLYDSNEEALTRAPLDSIHIFPGSREANYVIVSALDLKNDKTSEFMAETFVGAGSSLYMSEEAIYMAAPTYSSMGTLEDSMEKISIMPMWNNDTELYKFTISGTSVKMTARTTIEGALVNQFSMDEYNGYFRVATTTGQASMREANSNNHLFILDKNLKEVGKLTDLARGEKIYSVRFMGEKAYIVTFKETDPLFVIDVANPEKPKVLGELKIPGFSNYLHPLDENHLIGIGYDTKVETDAYTKQPVVYTMGMKVSLFDVSNVSKPKEVDNEIIGGRGTYSDVQHDHKALYRDKENGYYGFPIVLYKEEQYKGSGALVYRITPSGIDLAGDMIIKAQGEQYEDWNTTVQRLLYVDDTMYAVTPSKIDAYHRTTFEKLKTIKLK